MASPNTDPSIEPQHAGWLVMLRRHLTWLIAVKLGLLALLYVFFFSPAQRPDVDAEAVGRHLDSAPR
jgi:hypothetical protein